MASAAGVIQCNKPEVAWDRRPSSRTPTLSPAFPEPSGRHGKPGSIPRPRPAAPGARAQVSRSAFQAPAALRPSTRSTAHRGGGHHPSRAAGNTKPPRGTQPSAPRSFQAGGAPRERKPNPPAARGDSRGEARGRRARRAPAAPRGLQRARRFPGREAASGFPKHSGLREKGQARPHAPPASRARGGLDGPLRPNSPGPWPPGWG